MSSSIPALTSTAWAKAARNVALHLRNARLTFCVLASRATRGRDDIVFPNAARGPIECRRRSVSARQALATAARTVLTSRETRHAPCASPHYGNGAASGGVDTRPSHSGLGTNHLQPPHVYLDANLALKEKILGKMETWNGTKTGRYRPEDPSLKFLRVCKRVQTMPSRRRGTCEPQWVRRATRQ